MAISDDFRFIDNVDTKVRSLQICSKIVSIIGNKHLPKELLQRIMQKWSNDLFVKCEKYRTHRGILTKKTKDGLRRTTSFKYYIDFLKGLGFVVTIGDIVRNSKYGKLFNIVNGSPNDFSLSNPAKFFYLYFIFSNDGDAVLTNLDYLFTCNNTQTLKCMYSEFKPNLKRRLFIKQDKASLKAKMKISAKYRSIEANWGELQTRQSIMSKFVIPPRLEWMVDLGVLEEIRVNNQIGYSFTENGLIFYNSLIQIESNLTDISQEWLFEKGMTAFSKIIYGTDENLILWKDLTENNQVRHLSMWLEKAENVLDTDGAMRISTLPAMLFLSINIICENHVLVDFNDLLDLLKSEIKINNKLYSLRTAARINEGYINIKLAY